MADKDELYLNLVLEYVPETVYRVSKQYIRMHQHMPIIYVQLYTYQVNLKIVTRLTFLSVGCLLDYISLILDISFELVTFVP